MPLAMARRRKSIPCSPMIVANSPTVVAYRGLATFSGDGAFMTPFLLLFVALGAPPCQAEMPALFREKSFTCATLAEAVNHYVDLGEEAAIKELESLTSDWLTRDHNLSATGDFSRKERLGWVCRLLFQPIGRDPLRPPLFGAFDDLPWNKSMPLRKWPLLPVANSGTSYFVLSEGYLLAGQAEDPTAYLEYCQTRGKFRTERLPIPARAQALKDLTQLRQSKAWKAIQWGETGEEWSWRFIKAQAEDIPGK
jgi:hypothetical protein